MKLHEFKIDLKIKKKKNLSLIIFFAYFLLILNGCSGESQEVKLSLNLNNDSSYLIDGTNSTCLDIKTGIMTSSPPAKSAASLFFKFSRPEFEWSNTEETLYISYVKISFKNAAISGGKYDCVFSGDSLTALYNSATSNIYEWDGTIAPASKDSNGNVTPRTVPSDCDLVCGGVALTNPDSTSNISGSVDVVGYSQDTAGKQTPVKFSKAVIIQSVQ